MRFNTQVFHLHSQFNSFYANPYYLKLTLSIADLVQMSSNFFRHWCCLIALGTFLVGYV